MCGFPWLSQGPVKLPPFLKAGATEDSKSKSPVCRELGFPKRTTLYEHVALLMRVSRKSLQLLGVVIKYIKELLERSTCHDVVCSQVTASQRTYTVV